MIGKELKRLSRRELVDVIYQLKKNEQQLQEEVDLLQKALDDKRLRISEAGSIAEAAVDITDILSTAQTTADTYLNEIACMKEDTEKECAQMIADAQKQCDELNVKYQKELEKFQQLQTDIQNLEEAKNTD